jgi:hypothetical protein
VTGCLCSVSGQANSASGHPVESRSEPLITVPHSLSLSLLHPLAAAVSLESETLSPSHAAARARPLSPRAAAHHCCRAFFSMLLCRAAASLLRAAEPPPTPSHAVAAPPRPAPSPLSTAAPLPSLLYCNLAYAGSSSLQPATIVLRSSSITARDSLLCPNPNGRDVSVFLRLSNTKVLQPYFT